MASPGQAIRRVRRPIAAEPLAGRAHGDTKARNSLRARAQETGRRLDCPAPADTLFAGGRPLRRAWMAFLQMACLQAQTGCTDGEYVPFGTRSRDARAGSCDARMARSGAP